MLEKLLALVFPPRSDELTLRPLSTDDFLERLAPSEFFVSEYSITTLLPFQDPVVRAAIHEAKYRGLSKAQDFLAAALSEYLRDADYPTKRVVLVPVPLGTKRRRSRGFNQVEEVLKKTAKELELPLETKLLQRVRETVSQVTLPRDARRENMRGAFGATEEADPTYLYIVVDDVTTTGATLEAAVEGLTKAGAVHVEALALTH